MGYCVAFKNMLDPDSRKQKTQQTYIVFDL